MSDLEIKKWSDISEDFINKENSILLGNGFSIGYHEHFNYESLYEKLAEEEKDIFNRLNTKNFEDVLKYLYEIYSNENLIRLDICKKENIERLKEKNKKIRELFTEIIKKVHPVHFSILDIDEKIIEKIIKELSNYEKIFTTNYDLILYWLIMNDNEFIDLFWNDCNKNNGRCYFDLYKTKIYQGKIPIYYGLVAQRFK